MTRSPSADPMERLAELATMYRHLQRQHDRRAPYSAARRSVSQDLRRTAERFERTLRHWVVESWERDAWMAYLHAGATLPSVSRLETPPLVRGDLEHGGHFEVRLLDEGFVAILDGTFLEHRDATWSISALADGRLRVGDWTIRETVAASTAAIDALAAHTRRIRPGKSPPWWCARELYEDGLIDADFALTDRGKRVTSRGIPAHDRHSTLRTHA